MRLCVIDECDGKQVGRGLCRKHYSREYRTGTTDPVVKYPTVEGEKVCRNCSLSKLLDDFPRHKQTKDGRSSWCKVCTNERTKRWQRSGKYGLADGEYEAMVEVQGNACGICGGGPSGNHTRFTIDHDHETGRVRGLLCGRCNVAIGMLDEDVNVIRAAIDWLEKT